MLAFTRKRGNLDQDSEAALFEPLAELFRHDMVPRRLGHTAPKALRRSSNHWLGSQGRCWSGVLVGQERAQQLVIGTERAPTGRRWRGTERCHDLIGALSVGFWGIGKPRTERLGDIETVGVVHHSRPAFGEALGEFSYEHITHQTRDLLSPLCLGEQSTEHLHRSDVVLAKLIGQHVQRDGRACLGEGGERIVTALADPLIQARPDAPPPSTSVTYRPLPETKFIGIL